MTSSTRATCPSARPTLTTSTTTKLGGSTENTTTRRRRTDSTWVTWTTPGVTLKSSLFPHTSAAAADSHTHTINPAIDPRNPNCHTINSLPIFNSFDYNKWIAMCTTQCVNLKNHFKNFVDV